MSPFNMNGSNLRVETCVEGMVVDNDEWVATKAHLEHNRENYLKEDLEAQARSFYEEKQTQIQDDPSITAANETDLRNRGVATPSGRSSAPKTRKPRTKKPQ